MSILEDKKRKLETLKPKDKKKHSSNVLKEGAKDLYKGKFDGTLKGHMYGRMVLSILLLFSQFKSKNILTFLSLSLRYLPIYPPLSS